MKFGTFLADTFEVVGTRASFGNRYESGWIERDEQGITVCVDEAVIQLDNEQLAALVEFLRTKS
jgi:hypothetical protein